MAAMGHEPQYLHSLSHDIPASKEDLIKNRADWSKSERHRSTANVSRQSRKKDVDARHKAGHDEVETSALVSVGIR